MRLALTFRRDFAAAMAAEKWFAHYDVGPPMYGVLRVVAHQPGCSQRAVAEFTMLDPSDVVGVIDRMERNEWIRRERDPADRRRYLLYLTSGGERAMKKYDGVAQGIADRLLINLTATERKQFADLAHRALAGSSTSAKD